MRAPDTKIKRKIMLIDMVSLPFAVFVNQVAKSWSPSSPIINGFDVVNIGTVLVFEIVIVDVGPKGNLVKGWVEKCSVEKAAEDESDEKTIGEQFVEGELQMCRVVKDEDGNEDKVLRFIAVRDIGWSWFVANSLENETNKVVNCDEWFLTDFDRKFNDDEWMLTVSELGVNGDERAVENDELGVNGEE